jgi:heptosyltransferase I
VLRLSAIGDVCHTVPVVRALQATWPKARITWIIGAVETKLVGDLEGVDFITFNKRKGVSEYFRVRRLLQTQRFDVLLHLHASLRANILSTAIPADRRIGFDRVRAKDWQHFFCNEQIPAHPNQHVQDALLSFPAYLGAEKCGPQWNIPLSEAALQFAADRVNAEPAFIISPCSGERRRNFRNWRADHYAMVADHVQSVHGLRPILTGGGTEQERQYADAITARMSSPAPLDLIGKTSLKQLLALIQAARFVLCPDSGPAHMATTVGTPVIGLYATSNRWRTGPYFSQDWVVDAYPEAVAEEFEASVSDIAWGRRVRNPNAMDLISVDNVTANIDRLMSAPQ